MGLLDAAIRSWLGRQDGSGVVQIAIESIICLELRQSILQTSVGVALEQRVVFSLQGVANRQPGGEQ